MSLTITSPQKETYDLPFALRDVEYKIVNGQGFTGVIIEGGDFKGRKIKNLTARERTKVENCFVLAITKRQLKFAFRTS